MNFIPELNCWINKLYFESEINEIPYDYPSYLTIEDWGTDNSVINLLFNECSMQQSFDYMFRPIIFSSLNNEMLQTRLSMIIPNQPIYVIENEKFQNMYYDSSSVNILEITTEENSMLEALLTLRMTGLFDSTSVDYYSLQSNFSKLIYHYSELASTGSTNYDITQTLSDSSRLIEVCFERYLIETYFKIIEKKFLVLDSTFEMSTCELKASYEIHEIGDSDISNGGIELSHRPFEEDNVTLIYNGVLKKFEVDYNIISDSTNGSVIWTDYALADEIDSTSRLFVLYSYY